MSSVLRVTHLPSASLAAPRAQPVRRIRAYNPAAPKKPAGSLGVAPSASSGAAAAPISSDGDDAGSSFVQHFKDLSAITNAQPVPSTGSGCCGSSSQESAGSGCCGGSSAGASSGQEAASAVMQQLNGFMAGMQGSLTREDIHSAFHEWQPAASHDGSDGGERFLDVAAILRGRGEGDDDYDAELDALVV